ncbi:lytic transglycosylase domain-containing protein [Paucibacter sp. KBW04]|uniref:lytic transglycosylase domain-containing protein n=1 Tax=Paucibacter sp. KBW04 TaxID=2153361 RepID=UPI001E332495|nr:lytic transglycosylase domain-containing protein [Paucibacter sp. KBW04]
MAVYESRPWLRKALKPAALVLALSLSLSLGSLPMCQAQTSGKPAAVNGTFSGTVSSANTPARPDPLLIEAQEALRLKDKKRATAAASAAIEQAHPLAPWMDYWQLGLRLSEASQPELEAFYSRWPGSYVEDRLRNDWLLELGKRRDWQNFAADYPRFQMRDDREVACYGLLTEHLAGRKVLDAARSAWLAQRDGDDGCNLLASTLFEAKLLSSDYVWLKLRLAVEAGKPRAAKQAAALLGKPVELALIEIQDNPARYIARKAKGGTRTHTELATLALMRIAANDPAVAADLMSSRWQRELPAELDAWAWAQIGRQAALKLNPDAADYFERALKLAEKNKQGLSWSDDTLAWSTRAALRSGRWFQALKSMELMSPAEQRDPSWQYWRARALLATAAEGAVGEPLRAEARGLLQAIASPWTFYGRLAAEDLGEEPALPAAPSPLSPAERGQAQSHAGLNRALLLIGSGLRNEGVREWNFSLRGLNDRSLRAAAQEACEREIWDRCINTSERARGEFDLSQRYPAPHARELLAKSKEAGIDPAYVFGLIRQESRFVMDARSHVGASGLMQVMPATARWTAKKIGQDFRPELMTDRDFNIKIGTAYLKLVLDDFGGSMAMAAAAYNAGPGRPRRWREGATLDAAIWVENIPFTETRDYVKKVLTNASIYAPLLGDNSANASSLRYRLGKQIGPKESSSNNDMP